MKNEPFPLLDLDDQRKEIAALLDDLSGNIQELLNESEAKYPPGGNLCLRRIERLQEDLCYVFPIQMADAIEEERKAVNRVADDYEPSGY